MKTIVVLHTNNLQGAALETAKQLFIEFESLFQILNEEYENIRVKDPLMEQIITADEIARDLAYNELCALGCTLSYIRF